MAYPGVKRGLIIFHILLFLMSITFTTPILTSYASKSFGKDCLSCHQSGITVSTNATQVVQIETNASFWLDVEASGGTPREMMLIWSELSHNTYFSFTPSEVEDNTINDRQSEGGQMTSLFKITAPALEGNYTLRIYAASGGDKGGSAAVQVTVGAGGEIPKTMFEIIMGLFTTFTPMVLGALTILGISLYIIAWRRIPGGIN